MAQGSEGTTSRSTKWWDWVQMAAAFSALALTTGLLVRNPMSLVDELRHFAGAPQEPRLEAEISVLRHHLNALDGRVEGLSEPAPESAIASKVSEIETRQRALSERLEGIEKLIVASPEESLAIPMMRKDIERIEELNSVRLGAFSDEIERTYNLVITFLAALGVSVWAPALGRILRRSSEEPLEAGSNGPKREPPNQPAGADG